MDQTEWAEGKGLGAAAREETTCGMDVSPDQNDSSFIIPFLGHSEPHSSAIPISSVDVKAGARS